MVDIVQAVGPYEVVANQTVIGFMVRLRFAGVHALSDRGMTFHFWLKERIDSPRFAKAEQLGARDWVVPHASVEAS